jgi:hypothetical protein
LALRSQKQAVAHAARTPYRTQEVAGSSPASSTPRTPATAGVLAFGTLRRHLREIASGAKKLLDTQARKHHYVPSFLLARWATPQARDGRLFSLGVASGKVTEQKPGKVALAKDLYTLDRGRQDRRPGDRGVPERHRRTRLRPHQATRSSAGRSAMTIGRPSRSSPVIGTANIRPYAPRI